MMSIRRPGIRGSALIVAVILMVVVGGLASAFISISLFQNKASLRATTGERALAIAEAGIDDMVFRMNTWTGGAPMTTHARAMNDGNYTVNITPAFAGAAGTYTLRSTATLGDARRAIEAVVAPETINIWTHAISTGIRGQFGSNSAVDSYDSTLGSYASQDNNPGPPPWARAEGNVRSNGTMSSTSGNVRIRGDMTVSQTATMPGGTVSGTIAQNAPPATFPPIVVPASVMSLPPVAKTLGADVVQTIPSGDYHWSSLNLDSNAKLTIRGPAKIVVDGNAGATSNTAIFVDSTNGPVEFYFRGGVDFTSNTEIRSLNFKPADVKINITADHSASPNSFTGSPAVAIDSNAQVYATIYAPKANMTFDSNGQLFGAVVAQNVRTDSNFMVHYDEALADAGAPGNYRVRSWLQVTPQVSAQQQALP